MKGEEVTLNLGAPYKEKTTTTINPSKVTRFKDYVQQVQRNYAIKDKKGANELKVETKMNAILKNIPSKIRNSFIDDFDKYSNSIKIAGGTSYKTTSFRTAMKRLEQKGIINKDTNTNLSKIANDIDAIIDNTVKKKLAGS